MKAAGQRCALAPALVLLATALWGGTRDAVLLWPNGAPGAEGAAGDEVIRPRDNDHQYVSVSNIHRPSILVYLPPKERATGTGVVICPGGAHRFLAIDVEGYEVADWLNRHGIAAFILKYRLAREPGSHYTVAGDALADTQRAVRMVRSRALEWGVDPLRVGVMGFSAGGELAALAETRFDAGKSGASDPLDQLSSRPDFAVLVYPGFKIESVTVPKDAPPAFLVCADNDRSHVRVTAEFYLALENEGVPAEMHIYATGGHGFGMRDKHAPVSNWNDRLLDWMKERGFVPKAPPGA